MNPFAFIPLAAAVAIGFLAAVLFERRSKDPSVHVFLGFAALAAALCFVEFQLQSFTTTHEGAQHWARIRGVWPLTLALLLHFILIKSTAWSAARRNWVLPLLYTPAVLIFVAHGRMGLLVADVQRTRWGWTVVSAENQLVIAVTVWTGLICLIMGYLGLRYWRRSGAGLPRKQVTYIALGTLVPVLFGTVTDLVLPVYVREMPRLASAGGLVGALLVINAVRSTSLFVVSQAAAAAEVIISSMSDLLFLTDADGIIQRTNPAALHILGCKEQDILGKNVDEVLPQMKTVRTNAVSVKELETAVKTRRGTGLDLSMSASAIRDRDGRLMGMTFIGRDITDRKRAESARQLMVRSMIKAQDEERRRIARELHDETGQVLGSLIAQLRVLEDQVKDEEIHARVSDLRNLVTVALQEVQRISRGMHPGALDELGLSAALTNYADEFSRLHEIKVTTEILGIEGRRSLPPEVESTLYRVVQEALTNVARHAEAKVVSLYLVRQGGLLRAIIEDDGKGFDPEANPSGVRGLGLKGIRERVDLLGGAVRLETAPGEGVTLKIELPLEGQP